jgi:hypothetical protein
VVFLLASFLLRREKRLRSVLAMAVLSLAVAAALDIWPDVLSVAFGLASGVWALTNAVVALLFAAQLKRTGLGGWLRHLLAGLVGAGFALSLLIRPMKYMGVVHILVGVYMLLWAGRFFLDFLCEWLRRMPEDTPRPKLRMRLPVLLTATLPERVLKGIEKSKLGIVSKDGSAADLLQVFFHFGRDVAMGFGHADVCFRDVFYSYGCYDRGSIHCMGLLADGVILRAPRDKYIRYAIEQEEKTLVAFTIRLTKAQEARVEEALHDLLSFAAPWGPAPDAVGGYGPGMPLSLREYAGAEFFKLREGPYQTYNALKTNCVAMAEILMTQTGLPMMRLSGIITPGTYYAYLEYVLAIPDSFVIRREIYR